MSTITQTAIMDDVTASRSGDREAFGRIVAQYQGMVRAVAYSHTGDQSLSEDIAQEAFLAAWQRLHQLRHPERLAGWLAGIARHRALDAVRKRGRDPIHGAGELNDHTAAAGTAQPDNEAVVWDALDRLPVHYREPLVLFYREGQSVAETAAVLGLTEDCVKQRLARGRAMLRDRVADLVEDTLANTRPSTALTVAVMTALPALAGTQAAAQVAAETAAAGAAGKGVAIGSAAMLGGLIGAVAGFTGGFFGMWSSIRNTPTLRYRRLTLKLSAISYALLAVFLGSLALGGLLFWSQPNVMAMVTLLCWMLFLPALVLLIVLGNRRGHRIVEEDAGVREAPAIPLEESPLSLDAVRNAGRWSLAVAIPFSMITVWWLHVLPGVHAGWAGLIIWSAVHYVFWRLYRHGMRIAEDDVVFAETAPREGPGEWLQAHADPANAPKRRARFWNDVFAMAGTVWGPSLWLIISPMVDGRPSIGLIVGLNCTAVTALSAWLFKTWPSERHRIFFWMLLHTGVINGAIIGRFSGAWLVEGTEFGPLTTWAAGAACFALYAVIALGVRLSTAPKQP